MHVNLDLDDERYDLVPFFWFGGGREGSFCSGCQMGGFCGNWSYGLAPPRVRCTQVVCSIDFFALVQGHGINGEVK